MLFSKKKAPETEQEITTTTGAAAAHDGTPEKGLEGDADAGLGAPLDQTDTTATKDIVYPSGLRLFLLMASIFVSMFLVALVSPLPRPHCSYQKKSLPTTNYL